jgi:hypothetical protein
VTVTKLDRNVYDAEDDVFYETLYALPLQPSHLLDVADLLFTNPWWPEFGENGGAEAKISAGEG